MPWTKPSALPLYAEAKLILVDSYIACTGRVSSDMALKCSLAGIPLVVSRGPPPAPRYIHCPEDGPVHHRLFEGKEDDSLLSQPQAGRLRSFRVRNVLCTICNSPAVIHLKHDGTRLCQQHFISYFEAKVQKTILSGGMNVAEKERIAVALSGGKDSTALLLPAPHPLREERGAGGDHRGRGHRRLQGRHHPVAKEIAR